MLINSFIERGQNSEFSAGHFSEQLTQMFRVSVIYPSSGLAALMDDSEGTVNSSDGFMLVVGAWGGSGSEEGRKSE